MLIRLAIISMIIATVPGMVHDALHPRLLVVTTQGG